MKPIFLIFLTIVVFLAGCSGTPSGLLSEKEACQEAMRLMGKGTDVFTKAIGNPEGASANLTTLAFEFGQLIQKTDDKSLKAILVHCKVIENYGK